MSGRKPVLKPEDVQFIRKWWELRRILGRTICYQFKISKGTLRKVILRQGAYRG